MSTDAQPDGQTAAARTTATKRARSRINFSAYLFLLPSFALYATFRLAPYLQAAWYGLFNWNGASAGTFVGLGNYQEVINDPRFWNAASHNVIWMAMNLTIPLGIAFMLSILVAEVRRGQQIFRVGLFFPHVLSAVTVAVLWRQIYDPTVGALNAVLKMVGLGALTHSWLGEMNTSLPSANIASSWQSYGFAFVIFLAALQAIDPMLYEAAKLDGANWWQTVRAVTIPGLRDSTTMLISLGIMGSMVSFTMIQVMTDGGGPNFSSVVLSTYIYAKAFVDYRVGYACAVSVGLALWILLVTVSFIKIRERGDSK